MKKYVLITGVAGLIGSRLADYILINTEFGVIGIDNLFGGYIEHVPSGVYFHNLDVSVDNVSNLFEEYDIVYVYHLSAYAAEGLSPWIRCFNYENNLVATANIVNMCIKYNVRRLVFTSSMAVYGNQKSPFDESMVPTPIDPYGVAKYACEMDIQIAGEHHGLDFCIIRPHNVFGINQNIWDKYRNVLGIWMQQYLNDTPITVFGDGNQTRAFSYIDDSLEPLWNAAIKERASKQIINLGGIKEYSINEACKTLREVIGDPNIEVVYLEQRHEVKEAYSTYQKSIDILGFEHKTDLREGLTKMWGWAQEQPNRPQKAWSEFEIDKGIYSFWKNKKD